MFVTPGVLSMNPEQSYSLLQVIGVGFASLLTISFLLQKFFTGFKVDKAENSILNLMHQELERMSEQNTKLSIELGKLQEEVIELNQQIRNLTTENQRLHQEIAALTLEISKLKDLSIIKHKETTWHDQD
jgi:peptidoglycan hydrolase CwlO-like protein